MTDLEYSPYIKRITRTSNSFIVLDVMKSPMPIGMKRSPMMKKAGTTLPAVRTGCQAGSRCCLKAVLSGFSLFSALGAVDPERWPSSSFPLWIDAIMAAYLLNKLSCYLAKRPAIEKKR